mmetsp:Transcript_13844/g.34816  ORF Transcript_13844/g.34816 Transcript_13844/m.34816 type:complete len:326 (+) Transcript_13844:143-1120(+)
MVGGASVPLKRCPLRPVLLWRLHHLGAQPIHHHGIQARRQVYRRRIGGHHARRTRARQYHRPKRLRHHAGQRQRIHAGGCCQSGPAQRCQPAGQFRALVAGRKAPIGHRLLDKHTHPCIVGRLECGPHALLQQVPRRLHAIKEQLPVGRLHLHGFRQRGGLSGARQREAHTPAALVLQPLQLSQHLGVFQDSRVERGGVDLVQRQVLPQQGGGLVRLVLQVRQRVFLHLVRRPSSVHLPVRSVAIPPLATYHDRRRLQRPRLKPRGKELLRHPVAARSVEVTHSSIERDIQHLPALRPQIVHSFGRQIRVVPQIDVTWPAQRRQA